MVTPEEIRHVARLAKLDLSAPEAERLTNELGRILEYAQALRELDADEARQDFTHVAPLPVPVRPDEPRAGLPRAEVLALAPDADAAATR